MPVNTVSSAETVSYIETKDKKSPASLAASTDTFLKLLVAQLQYQDPLEPQTDTAFVTQLAQMTSLEQLQQMNSTLTNSQAYDMIGKYVYAEVLNSNTGVTDCYMGLAESVVIKDGSQYVIVGGVAIPVSKVLQVIDPSVVGTNPPATDPDTEPGA